MFGFQLKLPAVTMMIVLLLLQNCPASSRFIIKPISAANKDEVRNFLCQGESNVPVLNIHGIFVCENQRALGIQEKPVRSLREDPRVPSSPGGNPPKYQHPPPRT